MKRVYKNERYVIYRNDDGFIVQNILMPDFAHTHIDNFQTAKYIIRLSLQKRIPHDLSRYLMISLKRINDDEVYLRKINDLLENHKKKDMYINVNKGVKKRKQRKR